MSKQDPTDRSRSRPPSAASILDARLRDARKLEAVGRLARGVAHEFNNALHGINVLVDVLAGELEPHSPGQTFAQHLRDAVHKAGDLTSRLLAVSSDEPGPARDVGLNDVVRRLQPGLAELLPAGATLELDLDDAPVVRAPTTTVERAVVDLFLHARDAIDSGGTIRIVTSSAAEDEAPADLPRGRYARLVVEDDGAGMDDDTRDRALERFFFTTKAIGSGPGLGLSAVYGILRRIGGSVEIDAAPGQGTRIVTVWPSPKAGC